jgi:methyl-accepting chemotaxis protein
VDQARRVAGIAGSIERMRRVTGSATAGARESAEAGQKLTGQAKSVRDIVSRLVSIIGGGGVG